MNNEELTKKYADLFKSVVTLQVEIPLPCGKESVKLKPLVAKQYSDFISKFESIIGKLSKIGLPAFTIKEEDGQERTVVGVDATPKNWIKTNDKGEPIFEDGKPVYKSDKMRIDVDGETIECKRSVVTVTLPTEQEIIRTLESILWENARELMKLLFPANASLFTEKYIQEYVTMPFIRSLFDLVIDMNGLDFLLPFIGDMFPVFKKK